MNRCMCLAVLAAVMVCGAGARAADAPAVCPVALFEFAERGSGVKGDGAKVRDILFAKLAVDPNLMLVDREEMAKTLSEHELNLSGMVTPAQAVQVGNLTGAKILVSGSIVEADKTLYIIAKIIGTETSCVLGETVQGRTTDEFAPMVEKLAEKVSARIRKDVSVLVAKPVRAEDRLAELKKKLGEGKRPTVFIRIPERHVGQMTIDPAAETELTLFCRETGFEVLDPKTGSAGQAEVLLEGEGFSEFAARHGNLISVKARVELKAVDRDTGKIIAVDRQTTVMVDLSEQIAGKKALQEAAAAIAERMLPKIAAKTGAKAP